MTPNRAPVVLRAATSDDAETVAEIWHSGWRDGHLEFAFDEILAIRTLESFRARAPNRVLDTTVATVDGVIAGFVMVVGDEVEQVYVDSRYRGTDVAATLLHEAERQVDAGGHPTAWLAVIEGNARARAFYEREGWSDQGVEDYEAAGGDDPIVVPVHRYTKRVQ